METNTDSNSKNSSLLNILIDCSSTERPDDVDDIAVLPLSVRGMKSLNRNAFTIRAIVPALRCDAQSCSHFQSHLKSVLLSRPRFPSIVRDPDDEAGKKRLVLLKPSISNISMLSQAHQDVISAEQAEFTSHKVVLDYKHFSTSEILRAVLSEACGDEMTSSFETIGHIAHLNLRDGLLEYKHLIGSVILDKNVHIRTVVNKTSAIDTTFRFFKMELLAGEDNTHAVVKENGCSFEFDFAKVYWNSRLHTEHKHVIDRVRKGHTVMDVFAGVGPFAIPLAKKRCKVYANDLNPESYKWLQHNASSNKVDAETFNMDGRQFITEVFVAYLRQGAAVEGSRPVVHLIMNLPAIACEFLDVFRGINPVDGIGHDIQVHCYCFSSEEDWLQDVENRIAESLGGRQFYENFVGRFVRRVAPYKVMVCCTFGLLCFQFPNKIDQADKQDRKRPLAEDVSCDRERKVPCVDNITSVPTTQIVQ